MGVPFPCGTWGQAKLEAGRSVSSDVRGPPDQGWKPHAAWHKACHRETSSKFSRCSQGPEPTKEAGPLFWENLEQEDCWVPENILDSPRDLMRLESLDPLAAKTGCQPAQLNEGTKVPEGGGGSEVRPLPWAE